LPDENRKPPAKTLHGITLSFVSGPLEGKVFNMLKGDIETLIVGFDPVPKANASVLEIVDYALGASHAKLQLEVRFKKQWRLQVKDLKPKNGGTTLIGATAIPSGKTLAAGPGQTIRLGQTQVLVLNYKGAKADYAVAEPERTPTRRKRNVAAAVDDSPQVVADAKPAAKKATAKKKKKKVTPKLSEEEMAQMGSRAAAYWQKRVGSIRIE
jgi:hypothetical protein